MKPGESRREHREHRSGGERGTGVDVIRQYGNDRLGQHHHQEAQRQDDGERLTKTDTEALRKRFVVATGGESGQLRRHGVENGDHHDGVGHLEEGVGVGIRRHRTRSANPKGQGQDDKERNLVKKNKTEGPRTKPGDRPNGVVAQSETPADPAELGSREAWDQEGCLDHDPRGRPCPQECKLARGGRNTTQRGSWIDAGEEQEHSDTDNVVGDGHPHRRAKSPANI